jgi:Tol biopolymer transport system component
VKTGVKTALKVPANHLISGWSRDGKYFLTMGGDATTDPPRAGIFLVNMDGTTHKALTPADKICFDGCLSADGKRLLYKAITLTPKEMPDAAKEELIVLDLTTNTSLPVTDLPINGQLQGYCLSPDGKQIAYAWREKHQGTTEELLQKETESFLVVSDANGKNPKTISTAKGSGQWVITIMTPDWR